MLREQRGSSQEEAGAWAGIHRTDQGSVERGERNVALENLYALGVGIGVLFNDR